MTMTNMLLGRAFSVLVDINSVSQVLHLTLTTVLSLEGLQHWSVQGCVAVGEQCTATLQTRKCAVQCTEVPHDSESHCSS